MEWAEKWGGIFLTNCISDEDRQRLNDKWNEVGGYHVIPWHKWVLQNVSVSIDYKEGCLNEQNSE